MSGLFWAWLKIGIGLATLVVGAELLVRGASRLAAAMRVSSLVIGLTVVAFGTSAPELAVSVRAALGGNADLALGNVVGSNIFNVLFTLGLSALIVPLVVSSQLVRWDVPVMIGASVLLWAFGKNGIIGRAEGLVLLAGIVSYTWWCIGQSRKQSRDADQLAEQGPPLRPSARQIALDAVWIIGGLALLGLGSNLLVDGSVRVAESLGVSELVIGLTVVAIGTSLPEVVTSIMAALRGERDMAVGNIVGSNIFNILCVLGAASFIAPAGVRVSPAALASDIPVMVAVAVACLPIFFTGHVISRFEGGLFLFYYVAYTTVLVLFATGNQRFSSLRDGLLFFAVPLTVVTLAVTTWRSLQQQRPADTPRDA